MFVFLLLPRFILFKFIFRFFVFFIVLATFLRVSVCFRFACVWHK